MTLGRNLIAGLANSIWSALIGLAVVPFYLKYLGIEAYGLIGFFVTTQSLLQLLDMGMAPTINREVARCCASGEPKEAGKFLHTLAVLYWGIAVVIAIVLLALAPVIAEYWLQAQKLTAGTITHAVMLIGLVIACRWPIGLYQGVLVGAQRLTVSSAISIIMGTVGSLGVLAILAFVSPTIEAFFIWQTCIGLIYALVIRAAAWRIIGKSNRNGFDVEKLRNVWRFTAGMFVISLMGITFTQLDKVLLSKFLGLEEFAHYMLATVVASGLYVIVSPIYNAIYPRFSALVMVGDVDQLIDLYRLSTRMLAVVLFPLAMIMAVFADDLVHIWTGNSSLASSVAPVVAFLSIGSALNGIMFIPHALLLAFGMTRIPIIINGALMLIILPIIVFFALAYGAEGGAIAWFLLHVMYVLFGTWLTHRYLLKGLGKKWLFVDVGIPLGLSITAGVIATYICQSYGVAIYVRMAIGAVLALLAVVVGVFLTPGLRMIIAKYFHQKKAI